MLAALEIADFEKILNQDDCDVSRITDYIDIAKVCLKNKRKKQWENIIENNAKYLELSTEETIKKLNLDFNAEEFEENRLLSEVAKFYGIHKDEARKRLLNDSFHDSKKDSKDEDKKEISGYEEFKYNGKIFYIIKYTIQDQNNKLIFAKSANHKLLRGSGKGESCLTKNLLEKNDISMEKLLSAQVDKKSTFPIKIFENTEYRNATIDDLRFSEELPSPQVNQELQSTENPSPEKTESV